MRVCTKKIDTTLWHDACLGILKKKKKILLLPKIFKILFSFYCLYDSDTIDFASISDWTPIICCQFFCYRKKRSELNMNWICQSQNNCCRRRNRQIWLTKILNGFCDSSLGFNYARYRITKLPKPQRVFYFMTLG